MSRRPKAPAAPAKAAVLPKGQCGYADLLLVLAAGGGLSAVTAGLIGYAPVEHRQQPNPPKPHGANGNKKPLDPPPLEPLPPELRQAPLRPTAFWQPVKFKALQPLQLSPVAADAVCVPPRLPPLAHTVLKPWNMLLPRARQRFTTRSNGKLPDVAAMLGQLERGRLLERVPYQQRRRWGDGLQIIIDQSTRLTPFADDHDRAYAWFSTLFAKARVELGFMQQGANRPVLLDRTGQLRPYRPPEPGSLVLVLGDLGCLATHPNQLVEQWARFGHSLQQAGCRPVALTPCPSARWHKRLCRQWVMLEWDHHARSPASTSAVQRRRDRLLRLLSPAIRIEPALLRDVRRLLGPDADPGTEADVWQSADLAGQWATAATFKRQAADRLRTALQAEAATHTPVAALARQALALIGRHHAALAPEIWSEEVLSLDATTLSEQHRHSELPLRQAYMALRFEQLANSDKGRDYFCRFYNRAPETLYLQASPALLQAICRTYLRAFPNPATRPEPPPGFHPALLGDSDGPECSVDLGQFGADLLIKPVGTTGTLGSPLARLRTVNKVIQLDASTDPTPPPFWQSGTAPPWASAWGWDAFGAWASFTLAGVSQRLRWILPGRFMMGSPKDEPGRYDDEGPQHEVTISRGFWLFDTPCTQALWQAVMGNNPSQFKSPDRPVEQVSWDDAQAFIKRLNTQMLGLDLTLPTEAEWEYASRAGTQTALYTGPISIKGEHNAPELDAIAWYGGNSGVGFELENGWDSSDWREQQYPHQKAGTHPVGQKAPNGWGLYDMLGNVWEWCFDGPRTYQKKSERDPLGPAEPGADRVLRGGSWDSTAQNVRAAIRNLSLPDDRAFYIGFRCACGQASEPAGAEPLSPAAPRLAERRGAQGITGAAVVTLGAGVAQAPLPAAPALLIRSDREELHLHPFTRPDWAEAIGRDQFGLWSRFRLGSATQRMRWISPGRFIMGSPKDEPGRYDREGPQHEVTISQGFWLFDTPCTQALWQAVMGENPSQFKAPDRPVERVSWRDAQKFIDQLNDKKKGLGLTLPTEAQWEYACRAGTQTALYTPLSMDVNGSEPDLDTIAWHLGNSGGETHPVGQKAPNGWGLYDMLGNVWEWCFDGLRDYQDKSEIDPLGPAEPGAGRVLRGGSWSSTAQFVRAAGRNDFHPDGRAVDWNGYFGFRCACGQASEPAGAERSGAASPRQAERRGAQTLTAQRAGRGKARPGQGG